MLSNLGVERRAIVRLSQRADACPGQRAALEGREIEKGAWTVGGCRDAFCRIAMRDQGDVDLAGSDQGDVVLRSRGRSS